MKIELRNITQNERLSEETNCYAADLYVDGVKLAQVSNHGHGGADNVYTTGPEARAKIEAVEAWIKANHPKIDMSQYGTSDLDPDLELVCGELLSDFLIRRDLKRLLKRKVTLFDPARKVVTTINGKVALTPETFAKVRAKFPDKVILNTLPEDEALAIYRNAA